MPRFRSQAVEAIFKKMERRLRQYGDGTYGSRHEILGMLDEEVLETIEAVHHGSQKEIREELLDIAVVCAFGVACIDAGTLDW